MARLILIALDAGHGGMPVQVAALVGAPLQGFDDIHVITFEGWLRNHLTTTNSFVTVHTVPRRRLGRQALTLIRSLATPGSIIHAHSTASWVVAVKACPRHATVVATEHLWTPQYHLSSHLREKVHHHIQRRLMRKTMAIVAVSQAVKEFLTKTLGIPPEKVSVVHPGVVPPHLPPSSATSPEWRLVSIGALVPVKDQATIIKAAAAVKQTHPVSLTILGSGQAEASLTALAQSLGVKLTISTGSAADILKEADCYIQASLSESFGLAPLEAMSAGIPVITTAAGGMADYIAPGKNSLTFSPGASAELVSQIVKIMTEPSLRKELTTQGIATAEQFSVEAYRNAHQALYSSL